MKATRHGKTIALITVIITAVFGVIFVILFFFNSTTVSGDVNQASVASAEITATSSISRPPQYILLGFDGSKSTQMWDETMAFARELRTENIPVAFTYYISSVYFLNSADKLRYQGPRVPKGYSAIGFAENNIGIKTRVEKVNTAINNGHEIASHLDGHFIGGIWSEREWIQEFNSFNQLVFSISIQNPGIEPKTRIELLPQYITGFRAPELSVNDALFPVLATFGYRYDNSRIGMMNDWPVKDQFGVWHYPLASIPIGAGSKMTQTIAMDYSIYYHHSKAIDIATKGTPLWNRFYSETVNSYREYFTHNYYGNRAPVFIGHHFSKWNDGAYLEALKTFAREECGKPEVICTTGNTLADFLDRTGTSTLKAYKDGLFEKMTRPETATTTPTIPNI